MIYRESHLEFQDDPALPARGRFLIVGDVHGQMAMVMRLVRATGYDCCRSLKTDQQIEDLLAEN